MIKFEKYKLENGLKVILNQDLTTPMVVVNVLYDVGSKDENPDKTGFAHLFEHLMFGGSVNVPEYDTIVQKAGGENNAFTNNDITNYYVKLPAENLEAGLWIESDRMLELDFNEKSLEVQRNVVIEEFNQRYLNQPYGDSSLLLRPLAYKVHPYKWNTIGKKTEHIRDAKLKDVKDFFYTHYAPNNAILVVSGNFETENAKQLIEKWFESIPKREVKTRNLPQEPEQSQARKQDVERDVPQTAIYKAYHIDSRTSKEYYHADLISDILSNGRSSWFYQILVKEKQLFSEINAYITGNIEPGLFIIHGKILPNKSIEECENAINKLVEKISKGEFSENELEKVKNRSITYKKLSLSDIVNKATDLAYYELLGNASLINQEEEKYREISHSDITKTAKKIFNPNNCSTLYYNKKHKDNELS
ncbi:MAG: insulinase family protein [Bacteroidales bacterium]|nr:insulinase family protein [Bacteroidales bacterium]